MLTCRCFKRTVDELGACPRILQPVPEWRSNLFPRQLEEQKAMNSLDKLSGQSKSLREHLGNAGYAVTFVSAVGACLALGFALSMIVTAARRPAIVAP